MRSSSRRLLLGVILLAGLALRLLHIDALSHDYGEGVYLASVRDMRHAPLFSAVFSSQPPLFLDTLYGWAQVFGFTLVSLRVCMVVFGILGIAAAYVLAKRLLGVSAGLIAAAVCASFPMLVQANSAVLAETPSVALMVAALAAASFADRRPVVASLGAGLLLGLSTMFKLFSIAVVPALVVLLIQAAWSAQIGRKPRLLESAKLLACCAAGTLAAIFLCLVPYLSRLRLVWDQVVSYHTTASSERATSLAHNLHTLATDRLLPWLVVIALPGLVLGLMRRRGITVFALVWAVGALLVLVHQVPLFDHHLVLAVPPLALCAVSGIGATAPTRSRPLTRLSAVVIGACAVAVFGGAAWALAHPRTENDRVALLATDLQRATHLGDLVITDEQLVAAQADRDTPPQLVDTSAVRITTGYLTTALVESIAQDPTVTAVLFDGGHLDKLPGLRDWVTQHFTLAQTYGRGDALYLRRPA